MKQFDSILNSNELSFFDHDKKFGAFYIKNNFDADKLNYSMHCHESIELYFLLEGECEFIVDGKNYTLKPGNIIFIPPRITHKAIYNAKKPGARFVISCDVCFFSKQIQELFPTFDHYFETIPNALGNAEELFRKIHQEYKNPDEFSDYAIGSHLAALIALLFRAKKNHHMVQVKCKSNFIETTVSYIKENYSKHVTLDDAAKNAAVSTTYLSRSFKKETGFRFNEYLVLYRLMQAEAMLVEYPDKSILEIAYECGFNDSNYFTIRFKKKYGYTPTELRSGKLGKKKTGAL